jgi:hypothetical protein
MKIVFLNAWNGRMGDVFWKYIEKQKESTDVFVLIETDEEFVAKCKTILTDFACQFEYKLVNGKKDYYQSTYIKNKFKTGKGDIISSNNMAVGLSLYSKIEDVNLVNVHGVTWEKDDKIDAPERIVQSQDIIDYMAKTEGLKIVGGDFNLDLNTESVNMFEKSGYRNLISEFKIKTTRNHLAWDKYPDKQMYADFVFVSPEVKVKSFEVPNVEISDHLPLILEIER